MSDTGLEYKEGQSQSPEWSVGLRLFALSFTALFLELMMIRWVPSIIRLVAYYANLMLVSSFLGLGIGAMLSTRNWKLFRWLGPILMLNVIHLAIISSILIVMPVGMSEWRFQATASSNLNSYLVLLMIFIFNALAFVPLGEEIGIQFHRLPALRAYSWDLSGSLCGTACFGIFSLLRFSPMMGMIVVVLLIISLLTWRQKAWNIPCFLIALMAIFHTSDRSAYWSPYHFITVSELVPDIRPLPDNKAELDVKEKTPPDSPPADFLTMRNPPMYAVHVNRDFYQFHAAGDPTRYDDNSWQRVALIDRFDQYYLPFIMTRGRDRVLVLGAGGGMDVEASLGSGAKHVDAVEIDPVIPRLSNLYNAGGPYRHGDQVSVHIDDVRSFLQKSSDPYDLVIFGFLDSQSLFSYGASLRLDGYTYTIESFHRAYDLVKPGGAMSVAFFAGRPWLAQKIVQMVAEATGKLPYIYVIGDSNGGFRLMAISVKGEPAEVPQQFHAWTHADIAIQKVDLATDDWPYLYLQSRSIPQDYAIVIGLLIFISVVSVSLLRGTRFGKSDAHFMFMGWGFRLLQTKSIGDCSLYFGTTWFVTTLVITGVLLMVLLANWTAIKFIRSFTPTLYVPLFASLLLVLFVPREWVLGQSYSLRLLWTLLIVPLPIYFAGLIFSTTFREATNFSAQFGANLIGATLGGFCEYLGMWIGSQALSYIVIAAYIASLICVTAARRKGGSTGTAIPEVAIA